MKRLKHPLSHVAFLFGVSFAACEEDPKPSTETDVAAEVESETTPEVEVETTPDVAPETTPDVAPEVETSPEVEPEVETTPEVEVAEEVEVTPEVTEPTVKKAGTVTCAGTQVQSFTASVITGVLNDFTADGSLVTTDTVIDNCTVTTQVGTLPGGTAVIHASDRATCNALSCNEAPSAAGPVCQGINTGGLPYTSGGAVTLTMEDELLDGVVSHTFPKGPGFLTRSDIGASVSRGGPLSLTTSGGIAGTLTLVTIQQDNVDGQTTVICEFPADSRSVTIPASILGLFHDGDFNLLVDTRVQAFADNNGYAIALVVVNSTLPQQSTFAP